MAVSTSGSHLPIELSLFQLSSVIRANYPYGLEQLETIDPGILKQLCCNGTI